MSVKTLARSGSERRAVVDAVQDLLVYFRHVAGSLDFADYAGPLVDVTAGSDCVAHLVPEDGWVGNCVNIEFDLSVVDDAVAVLGMGGSPWVDAWLEGDNRLPLSVAPCWLAVNNSGFKGTRETSTGHLPVFVSSKQSSHSINLFLAGSGSYNHELGLLLPSPKPRARIAIFNVPHHQVHATIQVFRYEVECAFNHSGQVFTIRYIAWSRNLQTGIRIVTWYSETESTVVVGGDTCSMIANSGVRDADQGAVWVSGISYDAGDCDWCDCNYSTTHKNKRYEKQDPEVPSYYRQATTTLWTGNSPRACLLWYT